MKIQFGGDTGKRPLRVKMGQADQGAIPLNRLKQEAVRYARAYRSTQGAQQRKLPEEVRGRFQSLSNHFQETMGMRPVWAKRAAAREIARDQDMPEHIRGYFNVYANSPQNPEENAGKALDRAYRQGNWGLEKQRAGGDWGEEGFPNKRDAYRHAASNLAQNEDLPEAHRQFYQRLSEGLEGTEGRTLPYGPADTETAIAQAVSPPAADKFQQALGAAGKRSARLRRQYAMAARRMMEDEDLTQDERGFYKNLYGRLSEDIEKNPRLRTAERADSRARRIFNETKKRYGAEKAQKTNYGAKEHDPFDIDVGQDEESGEGSADTQARGQETPPSVQSVQSDMERAHRRIAKERGVDQGPETITLSEAMELGQTPSDKREDLNRRIAESSGKDNAIDRYINQSGQATARSGGKGEGPDDGSGGSGSSVGRSTYQLTKDMSGEEKYRAIRESVEANNPNASRQRVHQVALALMATDPNVSDNAKANAQRYANQMRQGHSPEEAQERAGVATEDVRKAYTRAWNALKTDEEFRKADKAGRNQMIANHIMKDPNASIGAVDWVKNRRRPARGQQPREQQSISELQRQAQKLRQKHQDVDTEDVEETVQTHREDMREELQDVQEEKRDARYRAASGVFTSPKAYRTYMKGLQQKADRIRSNYQRKIQEAEKKLHGNLNKGVSLAYSNGKGRAAYVDPLTGERKVIGQGKQWESQEDLRRAAEEQYKSRLRQAKKTWGGDAGQQHKYVGLNHEQMYMPDYTPGDAAKATAKAQTGSGGGGWSWSDNPITNTVTGMFT